MLSRLEYMIFSHWFCDMNNIFKIDFWHADTCTHPHADTHTHMHARIYHEHRLLHWYIYICVYTVYMCTLYGTVVWSTLWPILRRANPAQPSEHIGVQIFPLTWTSKEHWQRFVIFMFCCIWAESSEAQMGGIKWQMVASWMAATQTYTH